MADEPKKDQPEEIESILSDLDAILTDMGGETPAAPKAEAPKPEAPEVVVDSPKANRAEPPKPAVPIPIEIAKPVEAVKAAPAPVPVEPPALPPPALEARVDSPKANQPGIELAPREGIIKPPEKKPEPPKPAPKLPNQMPIELTAGPDIPNIAPKPVPVELPKSEPVELPKPVPVEAPKPVPVEAPKPVPVEAPKPVPVEAPKPAPVPIAAPKPAASPAPAAGAAPAAAPPGEFPADAPKEQIRRVAYIHTVSCAEVKTAFAAFLSQASRTISKKPLYLREVLSHEVSASSDVNAVLQKALQAKAVVILAVVEDWPPAKVDDLSDACSRANMQFRAVLPADAQKKSTAVDIIVDMMLLSGEG